MSLRDEIDQASISRKQALGRIADLLERNGIDVDEIGHIKRVSLYQSITKNNETGEAETHDLTAVQISPKWETGPEWPVIQQGAAVKLPVA